MALTSDVSRQYDPAVEPVFTDLPVKASTTVYEGAAVSDDGGSGVVDGLATGEVFLGFAEKQAIANSTANEVKCRIRQQGVAKNLAVTGVTGVTNRGDAVYALDSGSFTLSSSNSAVQIGKVDAFVATGYADVFFQSALVRSI